MYSNKGSAGIDSVTVYEHDEYMEQHIDEIKQKFNNGTLENIFLEITEDE